MKAPKKLNETDTEIPHIVYPFKDDSVQGDCFTHERIYNRLLDGTLGEGNGE